MRPCNDEVLADGYDEPPIVQRGQIVSKLQTGQSGSEFGVDEIKVAKIVNDRYINELGESRSATEDELTNEKMILVQSPYAQDV